MTRPPGAALGPPVTGQPRTAARAKADFEAQALRHSPEIERARAMKSAADGYADAAASESRFPAMTVGVNYFHPVGGRCRPAATELEAIISRVLGARSVLYERATGGSYVDVVPDREALERYGIQVEDLQRVVETAIGGEVVATTVAGRARLDGRVRYKQDFRATVAAIRDALVPLPPATMRAGLTAVKAEESQSESARYVPLGALARVEATSGPPMLKNEAGSLVGYLYVDVDPARDIGGFVEDAKTSVRRAQDSRELVLASGTYLEWTGQYEELERMEQRMKVLIPLALGLIVVLLYAQFRHVTEVLIVVLSIPFALVGSIWILYLLDYRLSTAVWVGVIALVGLAAQTGIVMIVYIDQAFYRRLRAGKLNTLDDIIHAHIGRHRAPRTPQADDRRHDADRSVALALGDRQRRRCDEAHRGTHGRRPDHERVSDLGDHSGHLHVLALRAAQARSPHECSARAGCGARALTPRCFAVKESGMSTVRMAWTLAFLAALGAAACKKSGGDQQEGASAASGLSSEAQNAADEVLNTYEALRAQLAADAVAEVPALAERMERAATSLARSVPASIQPRAVALGASARLLRETKELPKLREAFGEVSRQLVSILAIEPSLRKGRHVFECPMAQGYKKWIQTDTKLKNPYMGKAMLECGAESTWTS